MLHIEADRQTHLWHEDEWHTSTFPSSAPYGGLRCKEEPSSPHCSVMIMKITCKNLCDVTLLKAGSSATCWEFEETWGREKKGRSRWNKLYCRRSSFLTRKSASKGGALSADVLETRGVCSQTTTHTHTHIKTGLFSFQLHTDLTDLITHEPLLSDWQIKEDPEKKSGMMQRRPTHFSV